MRLFWLKKQFCLQFNTIEPVVFVLALSSHYDIANDYKNVDRHLFNHLTVLRGHKTNTDLYFGLNISVLTIKIWYLCIVPIGDKRKKASAVDMHYV